MAGVGAVVVEKWIQLYLNNNKKIKNNSRKKKELKKLRIHLGTSGIPLNIPTSE